MKHQDNQEDKRCCLFCGKEIEKGRFCSSRHKSAYYDKRRIRIYLTVSQEEHKKLSSEAEQLNMPVATLVKFRALNKKADHLKENIHLSKLRAELGKIGSNYNQIAHRLNSLHYSGDVEEIDFYDIKKILGQQNKKHFENIWKIFEEIKNKGL
jgi:hypothetical protein